MVHKNSLDLISDGKSIKYFECVPGLPLQIEATGKNTEDTNSSSVFRFNGARGLLSH